MASVGGRNGKRNSPGGGTKEEEKLSLFPHATSTSISRRRSMTMEMFTLVQLGRIRGCIGLIIPTRLWL